MADHTNAPTLEEMWDFLVGLKETTEAGFARLSSAIANLGTELRAEFTGALARTDLRMAGVESRLTGVESCSTSVESRLTSVETHMSSVDARLTRIESWNLDRRFDALEARLTQQT